MDDDVVRDNLWRTLQAISEWIRLADAKAGAALAVDGVMLVQFGGALRGDPRPTVLVATGLSVGIGLAVVSGLLAIWAVIPRMRWLGADSMIHYGTIAKFESAGAFQKAALPAFVNPDDFAQIITKQIWVISRSAARKYRLVVLAIQLLVGAMILGLIALLTH